MFFVVRSNDSFNFPLGLIKYIVIVIIIILLHPCFRLQMAAEKHNMETDPLLP